MQDINTPICTRCSIAIGDSVPDDAYNALSHDGSTVCHGCELEVELKRHKRNIEFTDLLKEEIVLGAGAEGWLNAVHAVAAAMVEAFEAEESEGADQVPINVVLDLLREIEGNMGVGLEKLNLERQYREES